MKTEVLIVGGGITGVGIARDLSLRGIPSILVEKGDLLSGASGRNHGLLHSGARYATSDLNAAKECILENKIIKKIADHCIEDTGGLFISLPEDGVRFVDEFLKACEKAEIPAQKISRDETLAIEPNLNPNIIFSVKVPDGVIDPFKLVLSNRKDAELHGANFLTHTEVIQLLTDGNRVKGVVAKDLKNGEQFSIEANYIVNATGAWANNFLKLAGLRIPMALSKGSLLITNIRLNRMVINRLRPPSDGDIIVPNKTVSILGTTSVRSEDPEFFEVTPKEVSLLIEEGAKMIPSIKYTRFIRAYAGIRPLFQDKETKDDRSISRSFVLIDHEERDGLKNLITITGGKLITYRLMAEKVSDILCKKMGINKKCLTHILPLPELNYKNRKNDKSKELQKFITKEDQEILCDCELIGRQEVEELIRYENIKDPLDIFHRVRLAKGTCQGCFCIYRLAGILIGLNKENYEPISLLKRLLEERWRGIRPILWGESLREEELIEGIYKGIFSLI